MKNGQAVVPDIITGQGFNRIKSRQVSPGCWQKRSLEKLFDRPRETINQWDYMLIDLVPDYCEFWPGNRQPLTDYHRWVLDKINRYQNKKRPWKKKEELKDYVVRNLDRLNFLTYMEQFT